MLARTLVSVLLKKVSKHLALLVCLLILGQATGRYQVGQIVIFGLTLASALLHSLGRLLQDRLPGTALPRGGCT